MAKRRGAISGRGSRVESQERVSFLWWDSFRLSCVKGEEEAMYEESCMKSRRNRESKLCQRFEFSYGLNNWEMF